MNEQAASETGNNNSNIANKEWNGDLSSFEEPKLTENSIRVLERRYLKKDATGKVIETPKEMIQRVARAIASAEKNYGASKEEIEVFEKRFYQMISSLDFLPNSPTLMNAGRELGQLSACFVLPVGDSIEEIFDAIKYTALIHKSGGGCASGNSRVFTTFCGLEKFEDLYSRVLKSGLEEQNYDENGRYIDVSELDMRCFSFDASSGNFLLQKIDRIWRYDLSGESCVSVRASDGTSVLTSCWHPFLVLSDDGICERRADELAIGDKLIVPGVDLTSAWPFLNCPAANGVPLDENICRTLGYLLGKVLTDQDGGTGIDFDGCYSASAEDIFDGLMGGKTVRLEEIDRLDSNEKELLLLALYERLFGIPDLNVFPYLVSKSTREAVASFIEGLMEASNKNDLGEGLELIIPVDLAKDIAALLTLVGLSPDVEEAGENAMLRVRNWPEKGSDILKSGRHRPNEQYAVVGIVDVSSGNSGNSRFFDFTVRGTNNYLAGEFGLTVIHNTGFSFSRLRPAKDKVMSTKGISSGPLSFMEVFNSATETIKQGGTRRGANMGILKIDHPDILEFITAKKDQKRLTNFNISVALTDKFMKAVKEKTKYDLVNPRSGDVTEQLDANNVFDLIVNMAWRNGEPGIVFIDRINRDNATPDIGQIESTNPCGEQPLLPFESCNLGSINLSHMLKKEEGRWTIDWDKLRESTVWGVRFLDNVIDMNRYPLPQIEEMTKGNRKIGLGIMGFADMLILLGVPYDSDDALEISRNLMKFIHTNARKASQHLAETRGSFPNFSRSTLRGKYPLMRNATVTTIAPTGTISIIAGSSSGIEPLFAIAYTRNVMDKDELFEVNPAFEAVAKERDFYSEELMKEIAAQGSIAELPQIPEDVKRLFVTSHDVTPETHVRVQAAFQEYTDNAVSKTVNFPQDATQEDVRKVYLMAYDLGLKGVTVYRYGSRDEQVLNLGKGVKRRKENDASGESNTEPPVAPGSNAQRSPRPRPSVTRGTTQKMETGCGKLYVTINEDEHGLCEVFTQMGKSGGCTASQSEAIGRLISLALRSGIEPKTVVKQLRGIRCPSPLWQPGGMILSCSDAIAKALERYVESMESTRQALPSLQSAGGDKKQNHVDKGDVCPECPECGAMVDYVEGCVVCRSCGFSRCW